MATDFEQWSTAVRSHDAQTLNQLVAEGVATTALHYDAFLASPVDAPWSDATLALYACGPPAFPALLGEATDTAEWTSLYSFSRGTQATRGILWFYRRMLRDPLLVSRLNLIEPFASTARALHGSTNVVDRDYVPWCLRLVSEHPWQPETAVRLLIMQLWEADGQWSTDTVMRRGMFATPPTLVMYFLFYFRDILPYAAESVRSWIADEPRRIDLEPAFMYDLMAWDAALVSSALSPFDRAYALALQGVTDLPSVGTTFPDELAKLVYLRVPTAAAGLGVALPAPDASWADWLRALLGSDVAEPAKRALALAAPIDALWTLLDHHQHLGWVTLALQNRGTPLDDRILVVLEAFDGAPSDAWFDDTAARWRGTAEGLEHLLDAARRSGHVPPVWWTAVAYDNRRWQQEILGKAPLQTTSDDLVMQMGSERVKQAIALWEGTADLFGIQQSVAAWINFGFD